MTLKTKKSKIDHAINIVLGKIKAKTIDDVAALRFLINEAALLKREAEEVLNAKKLSRGQSQTNEARNAERAAAAEARNSARRVALTVFDTICAGRSVGDLWYSELEAMRNESAFAAALCDLLIKHGIPANPVRVKDMVDQKVLEKMIEKAKEEVKRKYGDVRNGAKDKNRPQPQSERGLAA